MAWNEPGGNSNNQDPWGGKRPKNGDRKGPPDLDEAFRKLQESLNGLFGGGKKRTGGSGSDGGSNGKGAGYGLLGHAVRYTSRPLDVALQQDGWLAVQAPDGGEAYVRTGSLEIDALGQLRTGNGLPVLGNGGPIAVPPEQKVEIGQDGTISIRALGEAPNVMAEVDRIKLVNPDPKSLTKGTDGLIRVKDAAGPQEVDANVRVTSGFLESSNVNAVEEMTAILSLSRQFELHVKMMRTAEDNASAMARVLQIS